MPLLKPQRITMSDRKEPILSLRESCFTRKTSNNAYHNAKKKMMSNIVPIRLLRAFASMFVFASLFASGCTSYIGIARDNEVTYILGARSYFIFNQYFMLECTDVSEGQACYETDIVSSSSRPVSRSVSSGFAAPIPSHSHNAEPNSSSRVEPQPTTIDPSVSTFEPEEEPEVVASGNASTGSNALSGLRMIPRNVRDAAEACDEGGDAECIVVARWLLAHEDSDINLRGCSLLNTACENGSTWACQQRSECPVE